MDYSFWITVAVFLIPAYVANSTAMLFGGKTRLDFGKNFFDGHPIFGKGKTWRGTIAGIAIGAIAALAIFFAFQGEIAIIHQNYLLYGFLAAFGAIFGDIAGSFLKRRFLIKSGSPALILDQLDFVAGAYLFTLPLAIPTAQELVFVSVFTIITHMASNYFAYRLGIKKVPW